MISDQRPLHIGFCSPALPDSSTTNGIVTYTRIMRDALREMGHRVTVVTTRQMEHFDGRVSSIPERNALSRRVRSFLEHRHKDGAHPAVRMQIVDAFEAARRAGVQVFELEESFGWAGRLVDRGPAIVERLHGPHALCRELKEPAEERHDGDLKEAAEIASMKAVQAVTAPTQVLLDELDRRLSVRLPLARAIPNPIPVAPDALQWRLRPADPEQLLYVGRFDYLKGADVVLRAFAQALERRPSLQLIMVGPDLGLVEPGRPMVHFDEFVALELPPQVRQRVQYLAAQPTERLAELRNQSGFTIVTSRFENFPYSIAEAMAVGMPVLASDTFGAREMVRDQVDGRIVRAGDVEATADAMVQMAGNPAQLAEFGRSARARVADWLSPERIARETVALYREALARI